MSVKYLDLTDSRDRGRDHRTRHRDAHAAKLDLADSAVHAPAAGFGDVEFYSDFVDKAAVLAVHLAENHPLPDGNKRVSWVAMRLFIEINLWQWSQPAGIDDAERAVLAIAAGKWGREELADWLRPRISEMLGH